MYVKVFVGMGCQDKANAWLANNKQSILLDYANCQFRVNDVAMLVFNIKKGALIGKVLESK